MSLLGQPNNQFLHLPYIEEQKSNGVFKYLTDKENGSNIHDCGIEVISDFRGNYDPRNYPKFVVSFDENGFFFSKDDINSTIIFDFKDKLINIDHYAIKSIYRAYYGCHMRNWAVEVSDDGINWVSIHNVDNCGDLNEAIAHKAFATDENDLLTRYCRIRVTGPNWPRDGKEYGDLKHYCIGMYQIEFNGYLYTSS